MTPEDLRACAQRAWHVAEALEQDHWAREVAPRGPLATFEASQALWEWTTSSSRRMPPTSPRPPSPRSRGAAGRSSRACSPMRGPCTWSTRTYTTPAIIAGAQAAEKGPSASLAPSPAMPRNVRDYQARENFRLRGPDMAPHSPYATTPRLLPSGAASHLDLFEPPAASLGVLLQAEPRGLTRGMLPADELDGLARA